MSANNQIRIYKEGGPIHDIWYADEIDMESRLKNQQIGTYPSLEEAIRDANRYSLTEEIEYGLDIEL